MKIQTTKVFHDLVTTDKRICVFQGSSRASKTYNILIYWVLKLLQEDNKVFSIVRKTLPALKGSVLRDLQEILIKLELYNPNDWHAVDGYFKLGSNIIEWFSVDDETKLRGRKRDYLFINEATELSEEEYIQLVLRTADRIVIDLNPSLWQSWIYDLEGREDVFYTIVTYKQNPFLGAAQIKEIENLQFKDQNLWRVFGLGQKGVPTRVVFNHQQTIDSIPNECKLLGYGIDFGWQDPSVLVGVYQMDDSIFVNEMIYARHITIPDFIYRIKDLGLNLRDDFIADSANPQAIEEMRRNGINCKPVLKSTILHGIDLMKRNNLFITANSTNTLEEFQQYVWKQDKNLKNLDEPIDNFNHGIDAVRYVLQMKLNKKTTRFVVV
jgi:phage terminase large subunit